MFYNFFKNGKSLSLVCGFDVLCAESEVESNNVEAWDIASSSDCIQRACSGNRFVLAYAWVRISEQDQLRKREESCSDSLQWPVKAVAGDRVRAPEAILDKICELLK